MAESADGLSVALSAAIDRLDSVTGDPETARTIPYKAIALAFVGFDVSFHELSEVGQHVAEDYGEPILTELARQADMGDASDLEAYRAGIRLGQILNASLHGVFALGVLVGELHREATFKREATSDD